MSKIEEEITTHKAHKKFLDVIAIASKNKIPVNQKQRKKLKQMREYAEREADNSFEDDGQERDRSNTFLTQQGAMPQNMKKNLSKVNPNFPQGK